MLTQCKSCIQSLDTFVCSQDLMKSNITNIIIKFGFFYISEIFSSYESCRLNRFSILLEFQSFRHLFLYQLAREEHSSAFRRPDAFHFSHSHSKLFQSVSQALSSSNLLIFLFIFHLIFFVFELVFGD